MKRLNQDIGIFSTAEAEEKTCELWSENFRADRSYPTFIRTCILLFPISVILTGFWAFPFPRNKISVIYTKLN